MKRSKVISLILCAALLLTGLSVGGDALMSVKQQEGTGSTETSSFFADGTKTAGSDTSAKDKTDYKETIHISTEEDLKKAADACTIDSYSKKKLFVLDNDITLTKGDLQFAIFGGTFDGGGHKIAHVAQTGEKSEAALFRRIEEGGIVRNLSVAGTLNISGTQSYTGGIAAINAGTISNCVFDGVLVGKYKVGGIAGQNEASGKIQDCVSSGTATANTYTAGIVGYNSGIVSNCTSSMNINTTYTDTVQSIDDFSNTIENIIQTGDLNSTENLSVITDTGGIAGFNEGQILFCENDGAVGYSHVGYNTGGIAGRSSGFVRDCTNRGPILGRKDVGGIVGQQEPYLAMEFSKDDLQDLDDQLLDLSDILDSALDETDSMSSSVSNSVSNMTGIAKDARNNIKTMTDTASDDIDSAASDYNNAVSQINDVSDSASDLSSQLSAYCDSLLNGLGNTGTAMNDFISAATLSEDEKNRLTNDYNSLQSGANDLKSTLAAISSILTDTSKTAAERMKELTPYLSLLSQQSQNLVNTINDFNNLLVTYGQSVESNLDPETQAKVAPALDNLAQASQSLAQTISTIAQNSSDLASLLQNLDSSADALTDSLSEISTSVRTLTSALSNFAQAVQASSLDEGEKQQLINDINAQIQNLKDMQNALSDLTKILEEVRNDSSKLPDKVAQIRSDLSKILTDFNTAQNSISGIASTLQGYADHVPDYENSDLKKSFDALNQAADNTPDVDGSIQEILQAFDGISFDFKGISSGVRSAGNNLYGDLDSLINEAASLNSSLSGQTSEVVGTLKKANDKIGEITDTLKKAYDNLMDSKDDAKDKIEDTSADIKDEDLENYTDGRTTGCTNAGKIEADNNVGGIVGTIGVEYDLDPEKDIESIGQDSTDFSFLARAIVDNCRNDEKVDAKNNYAGGTVGHMDIGLLSSDYNFAAIKGSDYVGGIVGYSTGTVRTSSAKCDLSGAKYVGGVAGYGVQITGSSSMVSILEGDQFTGAIAGDVKDVSKDDIRGNTFVSDSLNGINGISYKGLAEPVSYDKLTKKESSQAEFASLVLTFEADDETIAQVSVAYGGSVPDDEIPKVPAKAGFFGTWSRTDFSNITSDEVVTAKYERIMTLIPGDQTRANGITFLYAEGKYHDVDVLTLTRLSAEEDTETERWKVEVPDDGQETHTFRFLASDNSTSNTTLYLVDPDTGERTELTTDTMGDYLTFKVKGSEFILSADTGTKTGRALLAAGCATGGAAIVLLLLLILRKKKKAKAKAKKKA